MKSELIFQSSPWFILLCLLVGAVYAFVLYQKGNLFSSKMRMFLAILRGLLVSIVCFLLVNPLLRTNKIITEKPMIVIAIDNSSSMNVNGQKRLDELKKNISSLQETIKSKGIEVEIQALSDIKDNQSIEGIKFNQRNSNLSELLGSIKNNYEGRNVSDVILVSDGIANAGVSPTYGKYDFRIHTVGIGDTTLKKDVKINAVYANKIAYLGNKFPIQAEIQGNEFAGKSTTVLLIHNGKVIDRQPISFSKIDDLKSVNFTALASAKGMQHYVIEVVAMTGEHTLRNNKRDVYVDIVDGKEKILLVSLTPHPDIKALRSIIESNELYELTVKNIQSDNPSEIGNQPFDVLILHQLPDLQGLSLSIVGRLLSQGKPTFFILGNQTNLPTFNGMQQAVGVSLQGSRADKVTAKFNTSFNLFNLDNEKLKILEQFSPMLTPYGSYIPMTGSQTILYQRVGSIVTPKPLLSVNITAPRKVAVLAGEGIWQWRMEEFALTEQQSVVDEVILKTLQLISIKDDKRKLRVYPTSNEFSIDDRIVFENEAYNTIFERIYNQDMLLDIFDEKGNKRTYTYKTTAENSKFEISGLPQGVYKYKASTQILGKAESVEGNFIVKDTDLENVNTTADFNLLRTLASLNSGKFLKYNELVQLKDYFLANQSPQKLSSIEEMNELIHLKWLFFLLVALVAIEWGIRKYFGSY